MRGSLYLTRPALADYIANPDGRGELVGELKQLLFRHKVLFFRDQDLSPADHVLFAERFGQLETHPLAPGHPEQPKLVVLSPSDSWQTEPRLSPLTSPSPASPNWPTPEQLRCASTSASRPTYVPKCAW